MLDHSACPDPEEIRKARLRAGLTMQASAELIHRAHLQRWSEFERGIYPMMPGDWELFLVKTNQHPDYMPRPKPEA